MALASGLLLWAPPTGAELSQRGDLIARFDSRLTPTSLPRRRPAPVTVRVAGDVRDAGGDPRSLPQLRRISVAINRAGQLSDRGVPSCGLDDIQPATEREARARCGTAIVGDGHAVVQVRIPNQPPFTVRAPLLAFNGPRRGEEKRILAQVYSEDPPGAFVLTFKLRRQRGQFGTVMSTTLPPSARSWAYLTHFDMTLHRIYTYRGKRRSYISASCAAPAGFSGALFPFAKATYDFANGQRLTTKVMRSCQVRGE
jgi:hypothetical protein